jgi:hypothetical protein
MVAALVLGAIAILALALFLLVRYWSDPRPQRRSAQVPQPGPLPPPTPEAARSQLKLLVDRQIIDTGSQGNSDEARLAFRIDEPPPGSRLLRYDATTSEWVPVSWVYDAARRNLIAEEPVGDASLWVLEEKR